MSEGRGCCCLGREGWHLFPSWNPSCSSALFRKRLKEGKGGCGLMLGGWGFRLIITGFKSCKYLLTLLCLWETCKNKHRVELELKKKVFGEAFCLSGDTECLHCTWNKAHAMTFSHLVFVHFLFLRSSTVLQVLIFFSPVCLCSFCLTAMACLTGFP